MTDKIRKVGDLATEAFKELNRLQTKEKNLVKTGLEMFDCHIGGLLPNDILVIAGASGTGKSELLYELSDNLLNKDINSDADNYVLLEISMEMKMLNKILRATNKLLNKKKTDILFNKFTEDEALKVKKYYESLQDDRRFVVQTPLTPKEFYDLSREFCTEHVKKQAVFISCDHLLLYKGKDKQQVLEEVIEYCNLLKLEFSNTYFILISQINRNNLNVIKDKDNSMIPNNSWLFGSSFIEQVASYIVIMTNPYKLGINQFLKVNSSRYDYLSKYFGEEDNKGKVSFNTIGSLFYFITKTRESDKAFKDIFISELQMADDVKDKFKDKEVKKNIIPIFNEQQENKKLFEIGLKNLYNL